MIEHEKIPQIKKKIVKKGHPDAKILHFQNLTYSAFPLDYMGKILVAIIGGRCWLEKTPDGKSCS